MVTDEDDLSRLPFDVETAASVGEDDLVAAEGGRGAHPMCDGANPFTLVVVGP